jgi:hypothetical protein
VREPHEEKSSLVTLPTRSQLVKIVYYVEDATETGGGVKITMKPDDGSDSSISNLRESTESWLLRHDYFACDERGYGDYTLKFDLRPQHPFLVLTFYDRTLRSKKLPVAVTRSELYISLLLGSRTNYPERSHHPLC